MIKSTLKVSLIQLDISWENPQDNYRKIEELLPASGDLDLVILPEMFTTGFSTRSKVLAETMDGKTVNWLKKTASDNHFAVCGSIIITENGEYYNRFLWVTPEGEIQFYDKRHLFTYGNEHLHFSRGTKRLTIEYLGWKILPQVCYDLRFPVWSRNRGDYDIAIYVASWPEQRSWIWEHLLIARAIENQAYVFGVNRVGVDGNNQKYDGRTLAVAPTGILLAKAKPFATERIDISVHYDDIFQWRKNFPALSDADHFKIL